LSFASDQEIVAACQAEQRCLITLDLDFGNPLRFPPWDQSGIAVLVKRHWQGNSGLDGDSRDQLNGTSNEQQAKSLPAIALMAL
jgi:hypothetical protein